jgi:hypothetical protein
MDVATNDVFGSESGLIVTTRIVLEINNSEVEMSSLKRRLTPRH